MTLYILNHPYHYEMENLCRVFYPQEKIRLVRGIQSPPRGRGGWPGGPGGALGGGKKHRIIPQSPVVVTKIKNNQIAVRLYAGRRLSIERPAGDTPELTMAQMLFTLLRRHTGYQPPWGLLTGVRPSKLMLRLRRDEGSDHALRYFQDTLWVSEEKTRLAAAVAAAEEPVLARTGPRAFSLYISIPFCPSRCSYCSFVSHTVERASAQRLIPAYVDKLCEEIAFTGQIAGELGLELASAYVGGGTPTILSAAQLTWLCGGLRAAFDWSGCGEFTVEAGRPDTLTEEKLETLARRSVTRLSINPQSMHDHILERAGRCHTAAQIVDCYALARQTGVWGINMDLIAGLAGDTPEGFAQSLEQVIALGPENITVHTLALKRSAHLREAYGAEECAAMLRIADKLLPAAGYAPYYMYRQSRSLGNLENIGWSLPGHHCRYNIDMMEESHTILACGAGSVTKLKAYGADYLERVFSLKYPYEYLARFEDLLERKARIKTFYETYNNERL